MKTNRNLILLNFACIYFIWGANYLIVKNTLQWFPPYTLVFLRLSTASLIALTIARIRRDVFPNRKQIKNAILIGVFFFILCNSLIVWSQQYLDSGLVAVLLCSQPLFIAIIHHLIQRKSIPLLLLIGILCGAIGVYLLQDTSGESNKASALFILLVISASMFGATGAVLSRKLELPSSPWMNTGIQMSFASLIGGSIAAWNGDLWKFAPSDIPWNSWYSFFYMVLFGSIMSYTAYNYLLTRVTPNAVATHSFVNPLVALLLGSIISGEFYGMEMLLPSALLLSAVVLMLWSERNVARAIEKRVV
jgi:drug/metabolite transporter (DMT)-like permease